MIKISLFFFILLFFFSCNKEQVSESNAITSYELWRSKNFHNYSIDQSRSCFCPDAGELVRITVRSDSIFSVIKISDNSVITSSHYFTVDSLFGIINNSGNDSLAVRYNAFYGYPEFLDINPQLHPVDGGVLYETSNLQKQ
ncbi:MAG TPA: DUF6174 domain-containing protein [Ignavibacteriaceae bacterium]